MMNRRLVVGIIVGVMLMTAGMSLAYCPKNPTGHGWMDIGVSMTDYAEPSRNHMYAGHLCAVIHHNHTRTWYCIYCQYYQYGFHNFDNHPVCLAHIEHNGASGYWYGSPPI